MSIFSDAYSSISSSIQSGISSTPPSFDNIADGYKINIYGKDTDGTQVDIVAGLAEEFKWEFNSLFEELPGGGSPFGFVNGVTQGLMGRNVPGLDLINNANSTLANLTGYGAVIPALTQLVWKGTSHLSFSTVLQFDTITDPMIDVMTPIYRLSALALPTVDSTGLLQAPGPSIFSVNNEYYMYVHIGKSFTISNVIVTAVSPAFNVIVDRQTGLFNRAQAVVTFTTARMLTKDVLAAIMTDTQINQGTVLQNLSSSLTSAVSSIKSSF